MIRLLCFCWKKKIKLLQILEFLFPLALNATWSSSAYLSQLLPFLLGKDCELLPLSGLPACLGPHSPDEVTLPEALSRSLPAISEGEELDLLPSSQFMISFILSLLFRASSSLLSLSWCSPVSHCPWAPFYQPKVKCAPSLKTKQNLLDLMSPSSWLFPSSPTLIPWIYNPY